MNVLWRLSSLLLLSLLSIGFAYAEQKKIFDGPGDSEYDLHYIALNSTFLEPEIAKQYGLIRSKAMGLLNISVIRREPDGRTTPVMAVVQGTLTNELQQPVRLSFQQVIEGPAIYYLAQVQFSEGKHLRFDLEVYPEGQSDPLLHRFSHAFFND